MSVTSCGAGSQPVGDVRSSLLGVLVGEQLQRIAGWHWLGEAVGRGEELVGGRQHELGLGDGLGRVVQGDRRSREVGHLTSLVGHRELSAEDHQHPSSITARRAVHNARSP
jgi:hypothetical protein